MTDTVLTEAVQAAATGEPRRYVITGGPSSGKDDLIATVHTAGIPCMQAEPGREIYRKHRERLGRHLLREDRRAYSLEVSEAFIAEYTSHKHGIRFYNRGIPDGYGWEAFFGLGPTPQLEQASRLYRYDAIFVLDPLDTFEDADDIVWAKDREIRRVHELIVQGYYDAGYEPVFVAPDSAANRLDFICANLRYRNPAEEGDPVTPSHKLATRTSLLLSPNSVLANALLRSIDILRPRVQSARPARIEFVVGTQINGAPHLGTNVVQAAAFLLAKIARREFSVDTAVRFGALDNAPYEVVLDPETYHAYQQTYYHALGRDQIRELIEGYYRAFFDSLSEATDTEYVVETYTDQQAAPGFRAEFLRSLEHLEDIRWWLAPSHGVVHIRLPCPECGWAEKRADRTKLAHLDEDGAAFTAVCLDHGRYEVHVDPEDDAPYLDLATLYRNLIKERTSGRYVNTLHVMMKGGRAQSTTMWTPWFGS